MTAHPSGALIPTTLSSPLAVPAMVEPLRWHQTPRVWGTHAGRTGSVCPLGQDLAQPALPFMKAVAFG